MRKIALGGIVVSVMAMMAGNANAVTLASKGYVDSAIKTVEGELTEHTSNTTIHVTAADKTKWNAAQSASDVATAIATAVQGLDSDTNSVMASSNPGAKTFLTGITITDGEITGKTEGTISGTGAISVSGAGEVSVATGSASNLGVVKADGASIVANSGTLSVGTISAANIEVPESCTAESHLCVLTWKTNKEGGAGWVLVDISDTPVTE